MFKHPCRTCSSKHTKDDCEGCTKPDDYDDYCDQEHDRRRDDAMIAEEEANG